MEKPNYQLGIKEVMQFLPHRFPFLMVDRVLEISGPNPMDDENPKNKIGIKVIGLKNITYNEPQFTGHFPAAPVMPGVLIVEMMAQVASFSMYPSIFHKMQSGDGMQSMLVGIDKARFRAPIIPGDSVRVETEVVACRTSMWNFDAKAFVEGKLVAEATIMANLVPTSVRKLF